MEKRINRVMLPQLLPPVASHFHLGSRLLRGLAHGLCLLLLLSSLTSCGGSQPPRALLNEALSLQIQLTQTAISKSLNLPPMSVVPNVSRVRVEEQEDLKLGEQSGLRVSGRFDWQLPGDRVQVDSPFEVYLQRGERGESWRLARPNGPDQNQQSWLLYPLGQGNA